MVQYRALKNFPDAAFVCECGCLAAISIGSEGADAADDRPLSKRRTVRAFMAVVAAGLRVRAVDGILFHFEVNRMAIKRGRKLGWTNFDKFMQKQGRSVRGG